MRPALLTVSIVFGAVMASAGEPNDKDRIQGKWKVVSALLGNREREEAMVGKSVFAFDGDTVRMSENGSLQDEGTFKLNPAKKPKEIDLFSPGGQTPDVSYARHLFN